MSILTAVPGSTQSLSVATPPQVDVNAEIRENIHSLEKCIRMAFEIFKTSRIDKNLQDVLNVYDLPGHIATLRAQITKAPEVDEDLVEDFNALCQSWRCLSTRVSCLFVSFHRQQLSSILHNCQETSVVFKEMKRAIHAYPIDDGFLETIGLRVGNLQKGLEMIDEYYLEAADRNLLRSAKETARELMNDYRTLVTQRFIAQAQDLPVTAPAARAEAEAPDPKDPIRSLEAILPEG
jgi:hypothetical protein